MSKETPAGESVCKGCWELGSACGKCSRCIASKPTAPAGELTDGQIGEIYDEPCDWALPHMIAFARTIIAADRALRASHAPEGGSLEGNVKFLLDQCRLTVRDMSGERTGSRGVEDLAGSLAITFLAMQRKLSDAQAALAAKDALLDAKCAEIATLTAERDALIKDAARHHWIRDRTRGVYGTKSDQEFVLPHVPRTFGQDLMRGSIAQHLDDALDKAIAAMTKEPK